MELQYIAVVVALVVLLLLAWWRSATRMSRGNRRRQRAAQRGELAAESLLLAAGYRVVDRQVTARWWLHIDGVAKEVSCRADLLVRRRGRDFVAEVKTGSRAPNPALPATRRQLLEYTIAFPGHGLLVVDMEQRQIREVVFDVE
jgi:hypothetical protein